MCFKQLWMLLLGVSLSFQAISQYRKSPEVVMGPEHRYSSRSTLQDIVGYDERGIYTLRANFLSQKLNFVHYGTDLKETKSVKHSLKSGLQVHEHEGVVQFNDQLYLFTSFADRRTRKNSLRVQKVDKASLELEEKGKVAAEIDYSSHLKRNSGTFDFAMSPDSSKLLIYYNLPWKKGESERFGFSVFKGEMELLWQREVALPYKEELFQVEDYQVSNAGDIYLLGKVFTEKKKLERRGKANYTFHILNYVKDAEDPVEYPIRNNEKYFTDMKLSVDPAGDLICAGFYSEDGTYSILGSYYLKIEGTSQKVITSSFKEFDLGFITQNMSEKAKQKTERKSEKGKDTELFNYDLDEIIVRDDGGAVLIGEQYYVRSYSSTDQYGNVTYRYVYNYNDIIVVDINPSGTINSATKIPKKQSTTNDGGFFSSYVCVVDQDVLRFIFNDHPKNLVLEDGSEVHRSRNNKESIVVMVTVDLKGHQERKALFTTRDAEVLARPKVCKQVSKNRLVLYGQRRDTHRLAFVNLE